MKPNRLFPVPVFAALALALTLSCSSDGGEEPAKLSSSSLWAAVSSSSYEPPIPNPDPPAGVTAMANSTNSISIGWGTVSGATGYYIYRSTTMVGPYERIGSSKSTSYMDDGLSSGATYHYRVSGYNSGGEGSQSVYATATTLPESPTGVTATVSASANAITISWNPATGATSYRIYRSDASTYVGTSITTQYMNTGLTAGTTYDYWVTAYNSGGESGQSDIVSATTRPGTPDGLVAVASTSENSITVSWEEVSGATGYRIYRNSASSGTFTQVDTSGSASFTDEGLGAVTTYYYKVAAYNSSGEGTQSSYVSAKTLLSACGGELYDATNTNLRCNSNVLETRCGTSNWYNSLTQFCLGGSIYSKCNGEVYLSTEYCSNGAIKEYGSMTDNDGNTYKTVEIGIQTWMAENLNYNISGSKCYSNQNSYCATYGRLYNWATATTACPAGWHLPSDAEWNVLMKFVNPTCQDNAACAGAGTKLKASSGWNSFSGVPAGTENYGFSALPGGLGYSTGTFANVGTNGYWWSFTEDVASGAYSRFMGYNNEDVGRGSYDKSYFFSVRCVQD
ncbi:hypothetical protein R83H12_00034 [Fibrobacteria bacterium R8-3-H12]